MTAMTIYRRGGRTVDEDEALNADGTLRDGFSISVPLMFRDGVATRRIRRETRDPQGRLPSTSEAIEEELDDNDVSSLADAGIAFHDGTGFPAGHRPGVCLPTDPEMVRRRRAIADAYAEAELADTNAWRNPQPWAGAAALPAEVPNHLTADVLQMLDEKERAYYEAEVADQNAWRKGR